MCMLIAWGCCCCCCKCWPFDCIWPCYLAQLFQQLRAQLALQQRNTGHSDILACA
jgi:hypothetical protein